MHSPIFAEYIWLDGQNPAQLRSKTKILYLNPKKLSFETIPLWSFDGSSTYQAESAISDCLLAPIAYVHDPIRGKPHILVLCEVRNLDMSPHSSNKRHTLVSIANACAQQEPLFGIEQEYVLNKNNVPIAWQAATPAPQGNYYCGVGEHRIFQRDLVEQHARACILAGLTIGGINAEVMPGQWEFQIGPLNPLHIADQLWLARWLLERLAENFNLTINYEPKPVKTGDWNGSGAHTNFSTKSMREKGGMEHISAACEKLKQNHEAHIAVYGFGNEYRLTGHHETAHYHEFRSGQSDRGASVRIPWSTARAGFGYLEDRRPAANMDPYVVCARILETLCL